MKPSDDTRARVKALTEQLESGVKAVFESEKYKNYLNAMSRFHHYSFGNVMLILMQCPEASMVAGYTTWKKQFGRTVKKGEHGIMILAPVMGSRLINQDRLNPDTHQPIIGPDGEPEKEPVFVPYRSFRVAYVFDVSQTEGRELPSLGVDELTGDVPNFDAMFSAVEAISPVPVEFRPVSAAKGCYNHLERKIYVNEGMSQVQTLKTLIHETAHALLHDSSVLDDEIPKKDRHTKEVEAESIAYVVCQHFGIDTSDYSFPYVTGWSRGKELPELKASLECISKTSERMIAEIDYNCSGLKKTSTMKMSESLFCGEKNLAL